MGGLWKVAAMQHLIDNLALAIKTAAFRLALATLPLVTTAPVVCRVKRERRVRSGVDRAAPSTVLDARSAGNLDLTNRSARKVRSRSSL
jgi:hypothetical protein